MRMSGAQIIMGILENERIQTVAGIPGGANLPLYHAMGASRIRHILARHEQGAGFIAQGMARSTGDVAVCFATSGPGATNLLTAIADAKLDSIPIVAITGQVATSLLGTDAFQEIDTYGLSIPIVKHSVLVKSARELLDELPKAFRIARSGRPGPVLVDVPKDVQTQVIEFESWPAAGQKDEGPQADATALSAIRKEIDSSERPVIYAGAGCAASPEASGALSSFAHSHGIPVATTLMALGAFPRNDPLHLGMLGMHGTRAANNAIAECDLLIVLGARFDDRATGKLASFAPNARVVYIDIDAAEIGKLRRTQASAVGEVAQSLAALGVSSRPPRTAWLARVAALKAAESGPERVDASHPVGFLAAIARELPDDTIVVTDVGQHQMWAAQALVPNSIRRFLTSGGLGTMGFGLPNAIGAALANPDKQVLLVTGDGSLLMNIQELATLAELNLNVKVLVMDNGRLGLVRQQQELFYERRYVASVFGVRVDFPAIARGFGLEALDLEAHADPVCFVAAACSKTGPLFLRMPILEEANVYPMVPPGAANEDAIGAYEDNGPESAMACEEDGKAV